MNYVGEIAALGTSLCWASAAICFTSSARRIGAFATNHYRVLWATLFLMLMHLALFKTAWPLNIGNLDLFLIFLGGIFGIVIGDTCLIQSYVDVGPRLGLLLFSSYPIMTALIAWPVLGETLSWLAWIGFFTAFAGIVLVVKERKKDGFSERHPHYARGVILGLCAALAQTIGLILVKPVVSGDEGVDPLSATLLRLIFATLVIWFISLSRGKMKIVIGQMRHIQAMGFVFVGAIIGPFIGMWLLHVALKMTQAGTVAILMATTPIMILPIVAIAYREKISWRALCSALITFIGVAILLLQK